MKATTRPDDILASLAQAKCKLDLYTNQGKKNYVVNRLKKFLYAPKKVARVSLYRAGLLRNPDMYAHMFWGCDLRLPMWDEDAVIAYYTGSFGLAELPLVTYLIRSLDSGSVFYDIGSNLGLYTALGESFGAEVHSFEPNSRTCTYIKNNAGPSTTVNAVAVAELAGEAVLYETAVGRKTGMSSMFLDIIPQSAAAKPREMRVPTVSLDEYVVSHKPPTMIKIDVMNADHLVLKGAQSLLARYAPVLALRLYHTPSALKRTEDTLLLLRKTGYTPFRIERDGGIIPTEVIVGDIKFASTFIFKKV